MPRLVGKQSNTGQYAKLFLVVAIATVGYCEYIGITDFVPNFGKSGGYISNLQKTSNL